jgi:erythromycin esterase-like protein
MEGADMRGDDIRALAAPLRDAGGFDPLLDRVGDAKVVMLGESSHGTHDFYRWRSTLTQRLVAEHGFSFIAVEGDWPDCERVDRSVRARPGGSPDPREALLAFDRWPTWMWANEEVSDFCRWLQNWNLGTAPVVAPGSPTDSTHAVGFHGLDVYSLWRSLEVILAHLSEHDPENVPAAVNALRCLNPYGEDPQRYAWATVMGSTCEPCLVQLLSAARTKTTLPDGDPFAAFDLRQNAEAAAGAEQYYRAMVGNGPDSWNVRDVHMVNTLERLLDYYGPEAKGVVWAHNSHIGDARATDMAEVGMVNLGQLARERFGENAVALVGFGCHRGDVVAAPAWGDPLEVMPVPPARSGSLEALLEADLPERALFVFPPKDKARPAWLTDPLAHRAIGVVYRPDREAYGNYVPTRLGDRYDAFIWCPETSALRPLPVQPVGGELETFPLGV